MILLLETVSSSKSIGVGPIERQSTQFPHGTYGRDGDRMSPLLETYDPATGPQISWSKAYVSGSASFSSPCTNGKKSLVPK